MKKGMIWEYECSIPPNKNSKKYRNKYTGIMTRTEKFNDFIEEMNGIGFLFDREIKELKKEYESGKEKLVEITIEIFMNTRNTDPHNFIEVLLDGIQEMTGINDRNFVPVMKPRMWIEKLEEKIRFQMKIIDDPYWSSLKDQSKKKIKKD
jgi:hypothetical protein